MHTDSRITVYHPPHLHNSHQNNYHDVFAVLRDRKELFLNHFVAKNLTNSLFLVLLFNNVPDCFLYRLIRLQRNLKKLL